MKTRHILLVFLSPDFETSEIMKKLYNQHKLSYNMVHYLLWISAYFQ